MKNPIRSLIRRLLAALLCPLLAHAEFPDRTVKIVVPFDAGGSIDTVARALAQRLNDKWNVPVIVENRPGAGNTIGANAVAKAAPTATRCSMPTPASRPTRACSRRCPTTR